ncbi:hypothetical protein [Scytonema sp. NUACC26]|uniref:hypothetical protein n=1 Tax=Scytonema sp. NUACC26 TaxID=3140176 RepID=UPI0034DBEE6A
MTQSIPSPSDSTMDDVAKHQQLIEFVAAEDAANGEVSCGQMVGNNFSAYLENRSININDNNLRNLLREHLGHVLTESDFDLIISQVSRRIESLVMGVDIVTTNQPVNDTSLVEHIPKHCLQQLFYSELGKFLPEISITQILQFTRQAIHKSVLQPHHTWPNPIWVLTTSEKLYIAQAANLEGTVAMVRTQYPEVVGTLEVVTVGGVLAPNQIIALEYSQFLSST